MKLDKNLFKGYENTNLLQHEQILDKFSNVVAYENLANLSPTGVLKANFKHNGKLMQLYSNENNHVGVIAATRLGKTTQYVIPTILSFAKAKDKRNMLISDPKGELYRTTAETLRQEGYDVKLLNFRDTWHSEFWNPLTDIYRHYQKYVNIVNEVEVVKTENGYRNKFKGVIFEDQEALDETIRQYRMVELENIYAEIHTLATITITTECTKDPHWEDTTRLVFEALVIGMLEDSVDPGPRLPITEDNFSFGTLLSIMERMSDDGDSSFNDNGFFTTRKENSVAYLKAKCSLLDTARGTRTSILNSFNTKLAVYRTSTVRLITSTTSIHMEDLIGERPTAIYIAYRDELKEHYNVIGNFVQQAYAYLIQYANKQENGKLKVPYYFILDEFGNFPPIKDFDVAISASGGRNIYFILILQSYAQLDNVYGKNVSVIIRDNLNVHVFLGSNNPTTLEEFSRECGEYTRISPMSALSGNRGEMENFNVETLRMMPKSELSSLETGECIVTEAKAGYVLYSKMERYYLCDEFANLPLAKDTDYVSPVNPLELKYYYFKEMQH